MTPMKHVILASVASLTVCSLAHGGAKYPYPVHVETAYRYAYGSMGSARNSADTTTFIQCYMTAQPGYAVTGGCEAREASGVSASCFFANSPFHEKVLAGMNGDSEIFFTWTPDGMCDSLQVVSGSQYEPKK